MLQVLIKSPSCDVKSVGLEISTCKLRNFTLYILYVNMTSLCIQVPNICTPYRFTNTFPTLRRKFGYCTSYWNLVFKYIKKYEYLFCGRYSILYIALHNHKQNIHGQTKNTHTCYTFVTVCRYLTLLIWFYTV